MFFFFFFFPLIFLASLLLIISVFLVKGVSTSQSWGQSLVYECSFSDSNVSSNFYSIQFFLIGLSFMLFDLEIILLIPSLIMITFSFFSFFIFLMFFFFLMLGLFFEFFYKVF